VGTVYAEAKKGVRIGGIKNMLKKPKIQPKLSKTAFFLFNEYIILYNPLEIHVT